MTLYLVSLIAFVVFEFCYFYLARHMGIIDAPNRRSSHSKSVIRGGGIIFPISVLVWFSALVMDGFGDQVFHGYIYFLTGLVLVSSISFWDDIHPLPDSLRLIVQMLSIALMFYQLDLLREGMWLMSIMALVICVGATNIFNFMDGINGMTGAYSLAVLIPLIIMNSYSRFVAQTLLLVLALAVLVFCFLNFRPRNKAKCFAGDVGSVSISYILLFAVGCLVIKTQDLSWIAFMLVYGVDGCLTIIHRIMLHENIGQAHRKHAYQIMANELGISHTVVSAFYMVLQLAISLAMIWLVPNDPVSRWIYVAAVLLVLCLAYVLFMKKYYHLHEEYLKKCEDRSL